MGYPKIIPAAAAAIILAAGLAACAGNTSSSSTTASSTGSPMANASAMSNANTMANPKMMHGHGKMMHRHGMYAGMAMGPVHGMPAGTMGGDGVTYTGAPDLQAAISLVTAGGAPGHFSITTALTSLAGAKAANAEVAKLTKQYGSARVASFVAVQNYAANDAVRIATAAKVPFPKPTLHGTALAKRLVTLGLAGGTFYAGTQLDHLVTHKTHELVMNDIDKKFGTAADANYHMIADQAHYDLAQALGMTSVGLAAYH